MAGTGMERRRRTRGDLGVAYGLIGGAAAGAMLLALTGDVMWTWIGPGVGLLVGLLIASVLAQRDRGQQDR